MKQNEPSLDAITEDSGESSNAEPAVSASHPIPIVGIGASAGGLEALERLFETMPIDTGAAFVLVTHLDPNRLSMLPELLQRKTTMPVRQVEDGVPIEANCVYTIAPDMQLALARGTLQMSRGAEPHYSALPINFFFKSLAENQGEDSVGIILSGTGSDGAEGIECLKSKGGMVMVQDLESAKFDGMPTSANETGVVDFVLTPEAMSEKLVQHLQQSVSQRKVETLDESAIAASVNRVFTILRRFTNHDFSQYKHNTILRRIERRMHLSQLSDINEYVQFLRESEREANTLVSELFIGVTGFFRDPEAFDHLKNNALPKLFTDKPAGEIFRAWISGCSTGEEAYSIAIILQETMEETGRHFRVQIFGTDVDPHAIDTARDGTYPTSIEADVSPERLARYFSKTDDGRYRVGKLIREMLVFAPQNVISDPPFTRLDLLCCRNLLIYFQPKLQQRLMPVFHYSLRTGGLLFLGSSESVGQHKDLFSAVHKKWKIFRKVIARTPSSTFAISKQSEILETAMESPERSSLEPSDLRYMEAILNHSAAPPCAIIDSECNIVFIHGRTGKFLEPADGKASLNILDMARPGIKAELASAIRQIKVDRHQVTRSNLEISSGTEQMHANLILTPLNYGPTRGLTMVSFDLTSESADAHDLERQPPLPSGKSIDELELELRDTRESLQTMMEEMQASNEELKSTNEELQSTNEELQSTNEELETSKEELQSVNEESVTVNQELNAQIDELSKTSDDMKNLLDSTGIATVFLDSELRIRGYTPRSTDLIPLESTDKGRSISHFAHSLQTNINLASFSKLVLDDLVVREMEVTSDTGNVYLMRARPYRTVANMIDGVVLTFENVTELKNAQRALSEAALEASEATYLRVLRACQDGIIVSDTTGSVRGVNPAFCKFLGYSEGELLKMQITDFTHPDSAKDVEQQLNAGSEGSPIVKPTTFKKRFVCKDRSVAEAHVTTTWHCDVDASKPMQSITFVKPD